MTDRIKDAIDVFLDALNNGTLMAGTPCGCAVGNLVADKMGIKLTKEDLFRHKNIGNDGWFNYGYYNCAENTANPKIIDNEQSRMTGFTIEELAKIEQTFEDNSSINNDYDLKRLPPERIRKDQIHALEAVIKVMLEFDEQKESVREVFTEKAELIPV